MNNQRVTQQFSRRRTLVALGAMATAAGVSNLTGEEPEAELRFVVNEPNDNVKPHLDYGYRVYVVDSTEPLHQLPGIDGKQVPPFRYAPQNRVAPGDARPSHKSEGESRAP